MIKPYDILEARENRAELQNLLLEKHQSSLLVIRTNYPGLEKNNSYSKFITETIFRYIKSRLISSSSKKKKVIKNIESINSCEGLVYLISVDMNPVKLKKMMIIVETYHYLGRLVDIDVFKIKKATDSPTDSISQGLSRTEFGFSQRTCFICNNDAHLCVRSQKHSLEEVLDFIHTRVDNFKKNNSQDNNNNNNNKEGVSNV